MVGPGHLLWLGIVYHGVYFAPVNRLAYVFAVASIAGAVLLIWQGVFRREFHFRMRPDLASFVGGALIVYSLIVYPAGSILAGHSYPAMPTFGLPCPTTLFTVGMLAFLVPAYPRARIVVPVLRSLVGTQAAFLLDVPQDLPESLRFDGRLKALRRALSNLIDNAMKCGGEACIDVVKLDAAIRVCVEDAGPGLPEAELARVFEPFYRVEGSRSRETGGTGLGLAIARQVARSHGSDVHLGNRQSSGLRAVLALPRAQPVLQP